MHATYVLFQSNLSPDHLLNKVSSCRQPMGRLSPLSVLSVSSWPFTLGAEALKHHQLIIDLRHRWLLDGLTSLFMTCTSGAAPQVHIISGVSPRSTLRYLLKNKYRQTTAKFSQTAFLSREISIFLDLLIHHQIVNNGRLVVAWSPRGKTPHRSKVGVRLAVRAWCHSALFEAVDQRSEPDFQGWRQVARYG